MWLIFDSNKYKITKLNLMFRVRIETVKVFPKMCTIVVILIEHMMMGVKGQ